MALSFRNDSAIQTGFAVETTEGTAATITSANFVGDWSPSLAHAKFSTAEVKVAGSPGTDKIVTTKYYAEISSFKMPIMNGNESALFRAGGAYLSGTTYYIGGSVYSNIAAADKGRLTNTSLTVVQYDGKEYYVLAGARPATLKFGAKAGEIVEVEASLNGSWTKSNTSIALYQTPSSSFNINKLLNSTISLSGTSFDYTDIEIDFKPKLSNVESAAVASGYAAFEIADIDPTITVTLYPGDPAVKDLWSIFATNAPMPFVWSFGSGTGNTYTVSANVQISSQDRSYNSNIQQAKLVLKPVFNPATNYKMAIAVA